MSVTNPVLPLSLAEEILYGWSEFGPVRTENISTSHFRSLSSGVHSHDRPPTETPFRFASTNSRVSFCRNASFFVASGCGSDFVIGEICCFDGCDLLVLQIEEGLCLGPRYL